MSAFHILQNCMKENITEDADVATSTNAKKNLRTFFESRGLVKSQHN